MQSCFGEKPLEDLEISELLPLHSKTIVGLCDRIEEGNEELTRVNKELNLAKKQIETHKKERQTFK